MVQEWTGDPVLTTDFSGGLSGGFGESFLILTLTKEPQGKMILDGVMSGCDVAAGTPAIGLLTLGDVLCNIELNQTPWTSSFCEIMNTFPL